MKKTLGRYKIIKEIGRGAMGTVYQGYDPKIDRIVALKTIRKDRLAESRDVEDLVARFQNEVRAAGRLVHPNIIVVYDTGGDEETAYIAMEYIEGDTLENLFQKGIRFPLEKIIDIMDQICDGLDYTHRQGIIHRDLKPSNIMLIKGGRVKITDFGISKAVGTSSSPATQAGAFLGTPSYMSPEQIVGSKVNGRSDLFSLGIILYQLLTGEKPFAGHTISTLLYNIVNKDPKPPSQIDSSLPLHFDEVLAKALAKDPDNRYQTAKDFLEDLKRGDRGEGAVEASAIEATMTAAEGIREKFYPERKRYGLLVGLAALLLLMVLGGFYWMRYRLPKPPEGEGVSKVTAEKRVVTPVEKNPAGPTVLPAEEGEKAETMGALGTIVVNSDPPGASVRLDGEEMGSTPTVIEKVPLGEKHEVRVEKKGYGTWVRTVEPDANNPVPLQARLEKLVGTIVVESTPPGASVFLDGEKVADSTPFELPHVSADETHEIQVKKEGYATRAQTITLKPGEVRELEVAMKPLLGEVWISSDPPEAKVYLNDKDTGRTTPTRISGLSPGNYTLKLKKEGYEVWEDDVVVEVSQRLDLPGVTLKKAFGELNLFAFPWAHVYHKGKQLGTTPVARIRFQEGTHELTLKNPPLKIEKPITVKIVAGKVTKTSVDLTEGIKGRLKIRVIPWAHVYVDGKPMGMTPLKPLELTVGEHIILVKNDKLERQQSSRIIIKSNEVYSMVVDLLKKE